VELPGVNVIGVEQLQRNFEVFERGIAGAFFGLGGNKNLITVALKALTYILLTPPVRSSERLVFVLSLDACSLLVHQSGDLFRQFDQFVWVSLCQPIPFCFFVFVHAADYSPRRRSMILRPSAARGLLLQQAPSAAMELIDAVGLSAH